jgi:cytochrome c biogenesis protein CcmG/thiol:disulfide interchange protein DsbE
MSSISIAKYAIYVLVVAVILSQVLSGTVSGRMLQAQDSKATNERFVGRSAPEFTVLTLDGRKVALSDYKGKALVVNFWATWCGNCRVEMPWLAQLREKYASQDFEVVGILTNNASRDKVTAITQKYGVKYPILMCNHATAQSYGGLPDLPESFFIDRHGKIVAEMDGADSKELIEANIRKALER